MIRKLISSIAPLDAAAMEQCQTRLDNLAKPLGSLHALEHLALKMAGITGRPRPENLKKAILLTVDGDAADSFAPETTAVIFARHAGAEIIPVPVTAATKICPESETGTGLPPDLMRALQAGIQAAQRQTEAGIEVLGLGEAGTSSREAAQIIVNAYAESETYPNPWELLRRTQSRPIAALTGVILAGAAGRTAVVLDGTVTLAAARLAAAIAPLCREYLVGSHFTTENQQRQVLQQLDMPAYLHLDLPAGGGRGSALGMRLIKASLHVLNDMKTFGEAEVAVAQDGPGALKQRQDIR
ncbi:MAG TPA: nicotinate-nucleotide--dimethylbenzimidazole phosphoribosyltransferase [Patescibacteria group bacterium]|nr:nicotinate-nucleotide--dimethylbenzimidazole phosphoribosyltransferase [Patescibacteria group bacterium]